GVESSDQAVVRVGHRDVHQGHIDIDMQRASGFESFARSVLPHVVDLRGGVVEFPLRVYVFCGFFLQFVFLGIVLRFVAVRESLGGSLEEGLSAQKPNGEKNEKNSKTCKRNATHLSA